MTPERLEELRKIAGGISDLSPYKSQWMDELIDHIDELENRLTVEINEHADADKDRCDAREVVEAAKKFVTADNYCPIAMELEQDRTRQALAKLEDKT
jgi:ribosome assembly protein YihI (activator of Der GTPase)